MSLRKTHICVVKSLVKIAAVSWHSLRRFIKPASAIHQLTGTEIHNTVDIFDILEKMFALSVTIKTVKHAKPNKSLKPKHGGSTNKSRWFTSCDVK